jgi:predicted aldo/keto reductase-like oxidoreductase
MIYKRFKELTLSALGMGNMRLPTINGKREAIDEAKAREIIEYAYSHGVNYYDTAYRYHGGSSETFVGKVLHQYPRDTWYLASKMPGHMMQAKDGKIVPVGYLAGETILSVADIFEEQLLKCGVDYFDFYLLHNVCETSYGFYTDQTIRVVEYLLEQKKAGRIRHLGFSAHGRAETIERFLNTFNCFEFVQLQLNYLDWILQDAKRKYETVTSRGIPVIVMEPVRGGRLASLSNEANEMLKKVRPLDSIASWAFRFLQALPNVLVVLSGMTTMEQVQENVALYSKSDPLSEAEKKLLFKAVSDMMRLIPCTACRYCCEGCPQGLDIPKLISMYNEASNAASGTMHFTLGAMKKEELPSACLGCGACAQLCPQGIDVPGVMKRYALLLRG